MVCLSVFLSIIVCGLSVVFGQSDRFEYECDILSKLNHLENELNEAKRTISEMDTRIKEADDKILSLTENATPGSTYVRWGRTTCPENGTDLVYAGIAGGSWYEHPGGAVNYICLPESPVYGDYYEDDVQNGGLVFGAEYQFNRRTSQMKFFPDIPENITLLDKNVPCAVCRTTRSTTLMIPAQNTCMDGWTHEYMGFLVSNDYGYAAASEYICLDGQPEYVTGSASNVNGKLLYFVEGRCIGLPCPPYVDGRELTCTVCTK